MNERWNKELYCLIGEPIDGSLSPLIHNKYYNLIKKNNIYISFNIKKKDLKDTVKMFKILNIKGFNVTLPHKVNIIKYLDAISKEARLLGAVNTVKNENGRLIGYNTDGKGFMKTIEMQGISINDKTILVLGAGGAAKAITISLAKGGARRIIIANRTVATAKMLGETVLGSFPEVQVNYDDLRLNRMSRGSIHMVINCTSVGMYPNENTNPIEFDGFNRELILFDIIYKPRKTKLMELAAKKGYSTINGISMLINQALYSQEIWLDPGKYDYLDNYEEIKRILGDCVE